MESVDDAASAAKSTRNYEQPLVEPQVGQA